MHMLVIGRGAHKAITRPLVLLQVTPTHWHTPVLLSQPPMWFAAAKLSQLVYVALMASNPASAHSTSREPA